MITITFTPDVSHNVVDLDQGIIEIHLIGTRTIIVVKVDIENEPTGEVRSHSVYVHGEYDSVTATAMLGREGDEEDFWAGYLNGVVNDFFPVPELSPV